MRYGWIIEAFFDVEELSGQRSRIFVLSLSFTSRTCWRSHKWPSTTETRTVFYYTYIPNAAFVDGILCAELEGGVVSFISLSLSLCCGTL